MPAPRETLLELEHLNRAADWRELALRAEEAAATHPDTADLFAYVAHAKRQLDELEDGYSWAVRGAAVDAQNAFVQNRVSLLANLTGRYAEAYAAACSMTDRAVESAADAQNVAVAVVNGIFAASRLDKIAQAVDVFTPVILRLDHDDLHYNSACLYALAHDDRVYVYMAKALAAGKSKVAFDDVDFAAVRGDPRFVDLLARDWAAEKAALERSAKQTRAELCPEDFFDLAVAQRGDPESVRHPALERAIEVSADEAEGYRVYSDWLQEQDDPRGLFVRLSERCAAASTESERMLAFVEWATMLHRNAGRWLGKLVDHLGIRCRAVWQHGFVRELVFDVGGSSRGTNDAAELLETTLALPMFRFVRALSIGDVPADGEMHYDAIVEGLLRAAPPCLRALEIGPNEYQTSWTHLDARGFAERLPRLESLVLGGGDITTGVLDFPLLRRFAIHTGGLTNANLAAICVARWPALDDLEIWFGNTEYGADPFTGTELAPILSGRTLPKLRRLSLMNAEFTDAICGMLAGAPIVAQLVELNLAMGTMTDVGAHTLAGAAPRFRHLARLVVDDNCISQTAGEALARALPNVVLGTQKRERYVTVDE